jgi:hypothetical protein
LKGENLLRCIECDCRVEVTIPAAKERSSGIIMDGLCVGMPDSMVGVGSQPLFGASALAAKVL